MGLFKKSVGRPSNKTIKVKIVLKIILFILIVCVAFGIGYFLNTLGPSDDNDIITEENLDSITDMDWKTPTGTADEVGIYQGIEDKSLYIDTKSEYNDWIYDETNYKKKYTYKCNNANCNGKVVYEYLNYAIIKDKEYIIYDYLKNKYKEINIDDVDITNIADVSFLYYDGKIYGYALRNTDDKVAIYNLEKKKLITDFVYNSYFYSESPELIDDNIIVSDDVNQYVLDFNNGKVKFTFNNGAEEGDYDSYNIEAIGNENHVYYLKNHGFEENNSEILDSNFNKVLEGTYSQYSVLNNGNILVKSSDNTFSEYNKDGVLVRESKKYKSVIAIGYEYVAVVDDDNYLKVVNNKGKELAKFTLITDKIYVHELLSGWYKTGGKEGLYVVVEDENIDIGTLGRGVEYYYEPTKNKTGRIELTEIGGYAKPVLYMYPLTNNTKITISFDKPNLLDTTYPKYNDGWTIYANKNGDLKDLNGNKYYALYWDEKTYKKVSFNTGFYVTKENAIDFLEEKLSYIGLSYKEKNEFIMYWLPILEKNEKSLVYFEFTNERQSFNKININPKPDSLLRLAIHIKKVNNEVEVKEQRLTKFERKGFTVVEWGGINY